MRRKRRMISDKRKRRFREESTLALVVAEKIAAVKMMRIRIRILTDRHARVERCIIRGW